MSSMQKAGMAMTDNTQELGEILDEFLTDIYMNNEHFAANQEALDKTKEEPMQAILDWHNKRKLEARIDENNMYIRELTRHYFPSGPSEPHIPLVQFHERIAAL